MKIYHKTEKKEIGNGIIYVDKKAASGSPRSDNRQTKLNIKPLATTENIPQAKREGNIKTKKGFLCGKRKFPVIV